MSPLPQAETPLLQAETPLLQAETPLLQAETLHVSYGSIAALRGLDMTVGKGETVAVVGPNGAGKSTLLRTIAGLVAPRQGRILLRGRTLTGLTPERLVASGISLVPEGRHIFGSLTVEENIRIGATVRTDRRPAIEADVERMLTLFPVLRQRLRQRAGHLSGGEQQMLALARALMAKPVLLLLDEPSLGLAPLVVRRVYEALTALRTDGLSLLIVEQSIQLALDVADRIYMLGNGRIVASGRPDELRAIPDLEHAYFGATG